MRDSEIIRGIGSLILYTRKKRKMTQKDLSNHSGVSVFTIANLENGKGEGLSLKNLMKILRSLNILDLLSPLTEIDREKDKIEEIAALDFKQMFDKQQQ